MNILDIDFDAFYEPYMGNMHQIDKIDKSKDKFKIELAEKLLNNLQINKDANLIILEDHDGVLDILRKQQESNLVLHVDAHSDQSPRVCLSSDDFPTLANWLSYAIGEGLIHKLISLNADKFSGYLVQRYTYFNGYEVPFTEGSLYSSFEETTNKIEFDLVCLTKSKEWCNYTDKAFETMISLIKKVREAV